MNIETGEMITEIELQNLPEMEQSKYIHLNDIQAKKYASMTPEKRVQQWKNDRIHQQKKVKKNRDKTKRSHKMYMQLKRKGQL